MAMDNIYNPETLNIQELDAIYAISRVVTRASELDASLDEIIGIARTVFIFDNIVLYVHQKEDSIEPSYARAIGRGRNSESDLAWGEPIANDVLESGKIVVRNEITGDVSQDRMNARYFLGLPLISGDHDIGALVFVRYGGPEFTPEHTHLAEYIAGHIAQLHEHGILITRLSRLEAERQLERLQDDFVATVSHELRTPLGFIKGYATTLLRDDAAWDEASRREFLTIIDEETDRLKELIDNLLDSSRLQSGRLRMDIQPLRLDTMLKDLPLRAKSFNKNLIIDVNLKGPLIGMRAVGEVMLQQGSGHIINIGSIAGLIATPTYSVYAATKYGLRGFTEALRREVRIHGIEVTGVYPGGVATEFGQKAGIKRKTSVSTPGFLKLTADDVAHTILRVVKKPHRAVIIPGLMRPLVWLSVIFPGLVDRIIESRFTRRER